MQRLRQQNRCASVGRQVFLHRAVAEGRCGVVLKNRGIVHHGIDAAEMGDHIWQKRPYRGFVTQITLELGVICLISLIYTLIFASSQCIYCQFCYCMYSILLAGTVMHRHPPAVFCKCQRDLAPQPLGGAGD
jgi:hypothetical protein